MPYVLTPIAKADIFDFWSYIADDSEVAADRVEQAIYDACEFVSEAPMRGHSRPDFTTRSLRFRTVPRYPNYAVVYRPDTAPLEIVAVLRGKRNVRRILIRSANDAAVAAPRRDDLVISFRKANREEEKLCEQHSKT